MHHIIYTTIMFMYLVQPRYYKILCARKKKQLRLKYNNYFLFGFFSTQVQTIMIRAHNIAYCLVFLIWNFNRCSKKSKDWFDGKIRRLVFAEIASCKAQYKNKKTISSRTIIVRKTCYCVSCLSFALTHSSSFLRPQPDFEFPYNIGDNHRWTYELIMDSNFHYTLTSMNVDQRFREFTIIIFLIIIIIITLITININFSVAHFFYLITADTSYFSFFFSVIFHSISSPDHSSL